MTGVGGRVYVGSTLVATGTRSDQRPSPLLATNVNSAASTRTTVTSTSSSTPFTAGAWWQITASLPAACDGVVVFPTGATNIAGSDTSTVLEIGTGASGSETVWATVAVGFNSSPFPLTVPGHLAAGTRVAVRTRSAVPSFAVGAYYSFTAAKDLSPGSPVTWGGASIATTARGVGLTVPGSLNTKGAWTEIVASTSVAVSQLALYAQCAGNNTMPSGSLLIDIGVGASGSESVVIPDLAYATSTSEWLLARGPQAYGVDIPAGSRIAARYARSASNATVDLILVGA